MEIRVDIGPARKALRKAEEAITIREALYWAGHFEEMMERVRTTMARDEMATDVRFLRTGPDSLGMMTNGQHYAGQEIPKEDARSAAGFEDVTDSGSLNFGDILGRLIEGDFEGLRAMIRANTPKPCPATIAILRFVHTEMLDHVSAVGGMALEAGNLREGLTAVSVGKWIEKSLAQLNEAAEGVDSPELDYSFLHSVMSVANPAWICEAQSEANSAAGFDATAATATVTDILNRQPGKKDRSEVMNRKEAGSAEGK